ncbi:MAG: hypothetical protein GWP06_00175 [Actinobacteria bacterium]|nr:hypothetical protein [Actinomycetota bacterium]
MHNTKFKKFLGLISLFLMLSMIACQSDKPGKTAIKSKDFTNQLAAGADRETIAKYLIDVRKNAGVTRALALHYPNLTEDEAYRIQMTMLSMLGEQGERLAGWKMGGARVTDPKAPFHPVYGFMLASGECSSGGTVSSTRFVNGSPLVEAEVGFVLKKDLPGPKVTREQVIAAIDSVGGFSELISIRINDAQGGTKATLPQFIADGLSNGGFIQPRHKYAFSTVDLSDVKAQVVINGEVKAIGDSSGFAFVDAILYLANSLLKYGRHLRAGDVIITGSVLEPPSAKAGDRVEIKFSTFEPLRITFK